jgi:hypothetical protein
MGREPVKGVNRHYDVSRLIAARICHLLHRKRKKPGFVVLAGKFAVRHSLLNWLRSGREVQRFFFRL